MRALTYNWEEFQADPVLTMHVASFLWPRSIAAGGLALLANRIEFNVTRATRDPAALLRPSCRRPVPHASAP